MKAAVYTAYGPASNVHLVDRPDPIPGPDQVLVRVHAAALTTADWRLRASAFPGLLWLPGRLMVGLFAPKNQILGVAMAGEIIATGKNVARFHPGQRVFGFTGHSAHAEKIVLDADGPLLETPDSLSDEEAAALPFGAVSALVFLRDVAKVQPRQRVLVVGATGGVGAYATQIAKALGAHVTAVAGPGRAPLLRDLGADQVLDYSTDDPGAARGAYDAIIEAVGALRWPALRRTLKPGGVFVPLNMTGIDLWHAACARLTRTRVRLAISGDQRSDLEALVDLIAKGQLRPVIDRVWSFDDIVAAHDYVEQRHGAGTTIIRIATPDARMQAAQ